MSTACAPSDRILQTLKVNVPGVTDDLLNLQLFNVVDEFFRRTNAWRHYEDVDMDNGTGDYGLSVPAGAQVVRALAVEYQGVPVAAGPTTSAVLSGTSSRGTIVPDLIFPDGDTNYPYIASDIDVASGIFSYSIFRPGYVSIINPPEQEAETRVPMKLCLALTVAATCLQNDCGDWAVEDWMWDSFFDAWLNGVQGRMYGMPAKPWSNPNLAQYHAKRFRNKMAFHKQEAMRGYTYNVPTWRFPRTWG